MAARIPSRYSRSVVEVERDVVLAAHAQAEEPRGHTVGPAVELGPRRLRVTLDDRGGAGVDLGDRFPKIRVVPVGHDASSRPHRRSARRRRPERVRKSSLRSVTWISGCPATTIRRAERSANGCSAHRRPTGRELAEAGLVVPHWPAPCGRSADAVTQLVIDEELRASKGAPADQPDRHRLGRARPSSTPARPSRRSAGSGRCSRARSSGASCSASPVRGQRPRRARHHGRARRRRVGGHRRRRSGRATPMWPKCGILLARTDPDRRQHQGISYFVCPMDAPGHRDPAPRRHDRGPRLQRGLPRRRADSGD